MSGLVKAPALQTSGWLNAPDSFSLGALRGRVVVIEAFQMLCPGCVSHGIPQALRIAEAFDPSEVAVIGLHTVFEHHAAQGHRAALEAFAHEYRLQFPIGIDAHDAHGAPVTMHAYRMQGTPTLVLIDRDGNLRLQHFGRLDDLRVGAAVMSLVAEQPAMSNRIFQQPLEQLTGTTRCNEAGCAI